MSEHHKVIKQALTRLYQRIDLPTATDRIHYRTALKAVDDLDAPKSKAKAEEKPEEPKHPLEGANVATVQALVEQGKVSAAEALEYEQRSDFPRKTLVAWLEAALEDEQ